MAINVQHLRKRLQQSSGGPQYISILFDAMIDALEDLQGQVDRLQQNVSKPVIREIKPEQQCRRQYALGLVDRVCDRMHGHDGSHAGNSSAPRR